MLEIGDLSADERRNIEAQVRAGDSGRTFESVLAEASQADYTEYLPEPESPTSPAEAAVSVTDSSGCIIAITLSFDSPGWLREA